MMRALMLSALAASVTFAAAAETGALSEANAALQNGEADRALALLGSAPESAQAHNLRCRVLYTLEKWDAAVDECEQAVKLDGQSSMHHLWLARALGEKADRAVFTKAFSLAKRVGEEFNKAVELDPRNAEALADLGEFDYSAPGIVGGGMDKAATVADQLDKVDPVRAHELRGRMAETHKDMAGAEREFKQALAASHEPAMQWMALASFYRRQHRDDELQAAVESGYKLAAHDRHAAEALVDGAGILTRAGRNLNLAVTMLETYLASSSKTEGAPAFAVDTQLAELKAQQGDKAAAASLRNAALALAHDYKPAQDLKI